MTAPPRRAARRRRVVFVSLSAIAVVALACLVWLGIRGALIVDAVGDLPDARARLVAAVAERDLAAAEQILAEVENATRTVADLTADPVWAAAEALPALGPNTRAVRVVAEHTTQVSGAAKRVLGAYAAKDPTVSGIDVDRIAAVARPLEELEAAVSAAAPRMRALDEEELLPALAEQIAPLIEVTDTAETVLPDLAAAVGILPGLLGADTPRHLLLVVQNTAELRSGGGLTGSFALMSVIDGQVTIEDLADSSEFTPRADPIVALPEGTTALYGDVVGRLVQNISMTTDFPQTAALATQWWRSRSTVEPDLVLAIDPVVLRAVLSVTGDVSLPDGTTLAAGNIVKTLLREPYLTMDRDEQTQVQQDALTAIFDRATGHPIDPIVWAEALAAPVRDGRVSLWSADAAEQRVIGASPLGGALARHDRAGAQAFAVLFNDLTTAKLGTFLDATIATAAVRCRADEQTDVSIRVTLTSSVPPEATGFPEWMTGDANAWSPGDVATNVSVVAPTGAFFGGAWDGDMPVPSRNVVDGAHPTSLATIVLAPGESKTLEFRFVVEDEIEPFVVHTPMINDVVVSGYTPACP